jgi:hypothetical protein
MPRSMNLIDEIKQRLARYPAAQYYGGADSITVLPTSEQGFEVELIVHPGNEYTISFNGWHENFQDRDEALNVFALGLSEYCRLREYRRGKFAYRWTLEFNDEGEWIEQSTTAVLIFPFWMKVDIRVLQNSLIKVGPDANS